MTRIDTSSLAAWTEHFARAPEAVATDLVHLQELVAKWQKAQNLVSRETLPDFWTRHILDSLQALPFLGQSSDRVFDFGSGGGFPGLPLAIATRGAGIRFFLCESNQRKVAFLRTAIRTFALDAQIISGRIEDIDSRETGQANLVLSRALAPLSQLMALAFPVLAPNGRMVVHKGRENDHEIDAASSNWLFDVVKQSSATDESGVLLEITHLRPRS